MLGDADVIIERVVQDELRLWPVNGKNPVFEMAVEAARIAQLVDEVAPGDGGNDAIEGDEKIERFLELIGREALQDLFGESKGFVFREGLHAAQDVFVFAGEGF